MTAAHYDLVVLGAGASGLAAARAGTGDGRRVALVDPRPPGGDCTWMGCVPSKTLLETAHRASGVRQGRDRGLRGEVTIDFAVAMEHVQSVIHDIAEDESPRLLARQDVDLLTARATFVAPDRLSLEPADGGQLPGARPSSSDDVPREVTFDRCVVAVGAHAAVPPIPGLRESPYLDNSSVWDLREQPEHLLVLGGGAIGCEMSQAFARLGSRVTLVEMAPRILGPEEPEASRVVADALRADGVDVRESTKAGGVSVGDDGSVTLDLGDDGSVTGSHLLVALGRQPATKGLGLDAAGVAVDDKGSVVADETMATSNPQVWTAGDCTTTLQFTHVGDEQGRIATANSTLDGWKRKLPWPVGPQAFDGSSVPWVTFTEPEVGRVGLSEAQAYEKWGSDAQVSFVPLRNQDRPRTSGHPEGFVKLVAAPLGGALGARAAPYSLTLVGMTAVAETGGDLVAEGALAVKTSMLVARVAQTIHAYPTWAMTTRVAAARFFGSVMGGKARPARPPADS